MLACSCDRVLPAQRHWRGLDRHADHAGQEPRDPCDGVCVRCGDPGLQPLRHARDAVHHRSHQDHPRGAPYRMHLGRQHLHLLRHLRQLRRELERLVLPPALRLPLPPHGNVRLQRHRQSTGSLLPRPGEEGDSSVILWGELSINWKYNHCAFLSIFC